MKVVKHRVSDPIKRAVRRFCSTADTPLSVKVSKASDMEIATLKMPSPDMYSDAASFKVDYLLYSWMRKYRGLHVDVNPEEEALIGFAAGEAICKRTNERLIKTRSSVVDPILYRAQQIVAKVLGRFDVRKLTGLERWGPGSSTDLRRSEAYLDDKYAKLPYDCTASALELFKRAIQGDLVWSEMILGVAPSGPYSLLSSDDIFHIVKGSEILTVDKEATKHRVIAREPRGNMFLQKACGNYIREKLLTVVKLDLNTQAVNQMFALMAHAFGLATLDLKNASNTISRQLIFELLPFDWAVYFDQVRSRYYCLKGQWAEFEMFSAMGNGFTFELETLLFYALTKASMADECQPCTVYGDDIICPSSDAHIVISTLNFCGFEINSDKSFIDGPFRESCGRHYFACEEVTPIYQKESMDESPEAHMRACNRILRLSAVWAVDDKLHPGLLRAWLSMYESVRHSWHPQIPLGTEGDDGYLVTHTYAAPTRWCKEKGRLWKVVRIIPSRLPALELALYSHSLRVGCVTSEPFTRVRIATREGELQTSDPGPMLDSRCEIEITRSIGSRWVEPAWQFYLD